MSPLGLIPAPYGTIARIALPMLAIGGAFLAGDVHGTRGENARLTAKYAPAMRHAADVMTLSAERIRRARAEAAAADLASARRIETAQATASQETAHALETQLDAARAAAADHARRLRADAAAQADRGGGGTASVPGAAGAAGGADARDRATELDADACAVNTVIAEGWQAWWRKVVAVGR